MAGYTKDRVHLKQRVHQVGLADAQRAADGDDVERRVTIHLEHLVGRLLLNVERVALELEPQGRVWVDALEHLLHHGVHALDRWQHDLLVLLVGHEHVRLAQKVVRLLARFFEPGGNKLLPRRRAGLRGAMNAHDLEAPLCFRRWPHSVRRTLLEGEPLRGDWGNTLEIFQWPRSIIWIPDALGGSRILRASMRTASSCVQKRVMYRRSRRMSTLAPR